MLFGKQNGGTRGTKIMHPIVFLPLLIAILIVISGCSATKGSIVILENPKGTGFSMDFKEWSATNKCELSLNKGDTLQIEVDREAGKISLAVNGKKGSEPYTGNDLRSGVFTVTVAETDQYSVRITGKDATGKVTVKNVGSERD